MKVSKIIVFLLFGLKIFAEDMLEFEKGSMYVGGDLTGTYERINFSNGKARIYLSSSAGVGYFLAKNFSMGLSLPVTWSFKPQNYGVVGLKLSSSIFFNTKSLLSPYIGLDITPKLKLIKDDNEFILSNGLTLGTLIRLSDSVAMDLGIRPEIYYRLNPKQNYKLEIPFGFVGVRAFF